MREIWRDIEGYKGLYQVSSLGNVKSLDRVDSLGHHRKEKILKPVKTINGYLRVGLNKDGKRDSYTIHRLVANAFIPNPNNLETVNHINEIKTDNRVSNLEWMTMRDNKAYSTAIPVNQYTLDGKFIRRWDCLMDIERQLGYYQSHISKCCRGIPKYKSVYGFLWKYAN